MHSKSLAAFITLSLLSMSEPVLGRYRWMERDDRPVMLHPRRFGQEHPDVINKLSSACEGQVCGVLAGQAITPLLAAQGECTQQDMADSIIDAAQQFDDATKQNMISLAVEYRQAEKNTPPDFTTNPPTNRNSVFCQKAPKNAELNGLVQAQDPANDPDLFFDPNGAKSVKKGSQANTFPFGASGASDSGSSSSAASSAAATSTSAAASATATDASSASTSAAASATTSAADASSTDDCVVTVTATITATDSAAATLAATSSSSAAAASSTAAAGDIGDFGSCTIPQIEFGVGFDNRKETSFEPVDKASYNHGSAQGIQIITQFMCDTLTNSCGADQTAKDTCQKAQTAALAETAKTGKQADAFNAVFGITTQFADVASVDDQGKVIAGTGSGSASSSASASASATSTSAAAAATTAAGNNAATSDSSIGNFGSCTTPQIEFGVGFDNRKETSFEPVDKTSYNHGSAQGIQIITDFICDTLTNSCGADQTAKDTCQSAQTAALAETAKTGKQADAFNAVFGITTNFAAVAAVDDKGQVIAGTGDSSASSSSAATTTAAAASSSAAATTSSAAAAATSSAASTGSSSGIGDFGKCSVPKIEFGVGFDNRKETSFQPADKASYAHDSAQNGDIITQFMCDNLVNQCGADDTAKATCAQAKVAFDSKTAKTGAQADAFNAVFGITTDFASVQALDNQGKAVN
ncbi:hypothetical protein OE88DRAFT_249467 [Heliocybe sulcata]|uniref:Uncharacterized protein n=1 Tax=Heliocybe sulcata TaxID=5364 RepID=A0A5C3MYJ1_9AGAM|nr:hypothetical protein OE88DRAFT_249467 [Heliocybe sulcata]